jgi:hypothetical protein
MSRPLVALYAFAAGLAAFGVGEVVAMRLGHRMRHRHAATLNPRPPFPTVVPITTRRNR